MQHAAEKWHRLVKGEAPRVLDLFSGCGGFSVGLQRAGWNLLGGVELEPERAHIYAENLHQAANPEVRSRLGNGRNILTTEPLALLNELHHGPEPGVDVIVGGPPCQAYARVGRAKLREVAAHPEAFLNDDRARLYAAYISYVQALQPIAVIMENVPDILNFGGENLGEVIAAELEAIGYEVRYTLLNAAWYGVPQTRERFFLIGFHRCTGRVPGFPSPTHAVALPPGCKLSRAHALKQVQRQGDLFNASGNNARASQTHYVEVVPDAFLPAAAVTCEDALEDLPWLTPDSPLKGVRKLDERHPYRRQVPSDYAAMLRHWPGFEVGDSAGVSAHAGRSNKKDRHIFEAMAEGDDYPRAHALAVRLARPMIEEFMRAGRTEEEARAEAERQRLIPCYDPSKFPNRWRKLERRGLARTLMSHLKHDCYTHIHYDSTQARTITVREAARLQSFPDGFQFPASMVGAFGAIGNAVPPLLALAVAQAVGKSLNLDLESQDLLAS